jgi:hypothetical protein
MLVLPPYFAAIAGHGSIRAALIAVGIEVTLVWAIWRPLRLRVTPELISIESPILRRTISSAPHGRVHMHRKQFTALITVNSSRVYLHGARWDKCCAAIDLAHEELKESVRAERLSRAEVRRAQTR